MTAGSPARRSAPVDPPRNGDAALTLRQILNPIRRHTVAGIPRGSLIGGVWPDGSGFAARFEARRRSRVPALWARWREGLEIWPFPTDPELPALAELLEGDYEPVSHRLGLRATVGAADGSHLLHLRPAGTGAIAFQKWLAIHEALDARDIPCAPLGSFDPATSALRSERMSGTSEENGVSPDGCRALGRILSRVHASPAPGIERRGAGVALDATVRQVALAAHSRTAFSLWLERRLDRWKLLGPAHGHARALVHGRLRANHVAWQERPVILDWENGGVGDPEEDLGSFAADLYWRLGPEAAPVFAAFRDGYGSEGGTADPETFAYYARLALVKLLASKALSEIDQVPLRSREALWAEWPGVVAAW